MSLSDQDILFNERLGLVQKALRKLSFHSENLPETDAWSSRSGLAEPGAIRYVSDSALLHWRGNRSLLVSELKAAIEILGE